MEHICRVFVRMQSQYHSCVCALVILKLSRLSTGLWDRGRQICEKHSLILAVDQDFPVNANTVL